MKIWEFQNLPSLSPGCLNGSTLPLSCLAIRVQPQLPTDSLLGDLGTVDPPL